MPADPGAGRVLRHHELRKCVRGLSADPARYFRKRPKIVGNARIGARFLARENVFVPKRIYTTVALGAGGFGGFQRRFLTLLERALLLSGGEDLRDVTKAGWQLRRELSRQLRFTE